MILLSLIFSSLALHAEATYQIELKDRKMNPTEIRVKAGEPFWLEVKNSDNTSEEIESNSMRIEKIIPPRRTVKIKVGAQQPGTYEIFGEFHMDTCQGKIVAVNDLGAPAVSVAPAATETPEKPK